MKLIGYEFESIDHILRRFYDCFLKAYAKDETDEIAKANDKKMVKRIKSMKLLATSLKVLTTS